MSPIAKEQRTVLFLSFILAASFFVDAQQPSTFWKELTKGRYAIGFDVLYRYDHSRAWKQSGNQTSRPIRISIWYPAVADKDKEPLKFIDYVFLKTDQKDFQELNQALEMRNLKSLEDVMTQGPRELLDTPMVAVSKARPAEGKFPVIAYASGLNETWQHANFVLGEYLASHGFVVIAVPQLGSSSGIQSLRNNAVDLEMQVRDLEFALGAARDFANADPDQKAVIGHSIGGIVALILQMRNMTIDAVVSLDSPYGWKNSKQWLTSSAFYQPRLMRVPLLDLRRKDDRFDPEVLQSFKYSERYLGILPGIAHSDFTSFPMIATRFPTNIMGRTPEVALAGYHAICRYTLAFLQSVFNQDLDATNFINQKSSLPNVITVEHFSRKEPPPLEETFFQAAKKDGYESAAALLRSWKEKNPDDEIINESIMTSVGYDLLSQKDYDLAISVLRLIVEDHPLSANAHDSVAEAYSMSGNKEKAIESYKKVIEVVDKDPKASPEQKKSLKENAEAKIKELGL